VNGNLSTPVDIGAVPDGFDNHAASRFVNPIYDPVITTAGTVQTFELESERMPDPLGHLGQRSVDELDRSKSYLFR
jgi:hypothetical protein